MPYNPNTMPHRRTRTGVLMRRFCDYETGDNFRWRERTFFKAGGTAHCVDPAGLPAPTFRSRQWLCEF